MPDIFIDGEAGTTGLALRERLSHFPEINIHRLPSHLRKDFHAKSAIFREVDLVVLCLPDSAAREVVAEVVEINRNRSPPLRILDASSAHRTHPDWVYGFPELRTDQEKTIRNAVQVSNPGCYATGALAILAPLRQVGLLASNFPETIWGISGYTGGGREMIAAYEKADSSSPPPPFKLYALGRSHKHVPEIQSYADLQRPPLFVPSVGNFPQGMLVQIPLPLGRLTKKVNIQDIYHILQEHYQEADQISIHLGAEEGAPILEADSLAGTDKLELWLYAFPDPYHILLVARFDNLGKGAAGAAVQNIGLMLGMK